MLLPLLLAALALRPSPDATAAVTNGTGLYDGCQAEMRIMGLPSVSQATESDLLHGSYCVGYLNGFVANLRQKDAICTDGSPIGVLVRTYVSYMAKNPDLLDEDLKVGLNQALRDAFPCPVTPSKTVPPASQVHDAL